jgi:predicted permease
LRVQVNVLYPCLILQTVLGNAALRQPANLIWPPLVGFGTIVLGFAVGYYAGRALGLARHYGGQPVIAAQIIIGTTVLGVLVIPLWLRLGLAWAGG